MTFEEAKARINEISVAAVHKVEDARTKQAKNAETIEKAYEALSNALLNENKDTYTKAKAAISKAEADRDYYAGVVAKAESSPVITEDEYMTIGAALMDEIRRIKAESIAEIKELTDALGKAVEDGRARVSEVASVIRQLEALPQLINPNAKGYARFGGEPKRTDYKKLIRELKKEL